MALKTPLAASALFASLAIAPASAHDTNVEKRENVAVIDQSLIDILEQYKQGDLVRLDQAGEAQMTKAILADETVDQAEINFLAEIFAMSVAPLRVRTITDNSPYKDLLKVERFTSGSSAPSFEATLQDAYRALLSQGAEGHAALLDHHELGEAHAESLKNFMVWRILNPLWKESSVTDAYASMRSKISELAANNKLLPESRQPEGRDMIRSWFIALDRANEDDVPNFLYAWLKQ